VLLAVVVLPVLLPAVVAADSALLLPANRLPHLTLYQGPSSGRMERT
jgi:hypothetical protein